jgi:hypothetical protein
MGILDDAIREHLELKRRRGADSAEVSRQEREILGGAPAADPAYAEPVAPVDAYDAAPEPVADLEPGYGEPDDAYDAAYAEPAAAPEPLAGSPLATPEADIPPAPEPAATQAVDDLFPGTGELMAAASAPAPAPAPAAPTERPAAPSLGSPAPAGADEETAARSGARRLSDEELAAWRKRLSERADRLAAGRPGGATEPAEGTNPAASTAGAAAPPPPAPPPPHPPATNRPPTGPATPASPPPRPAAPLPNPASPPTSSTPATPTPPSHPNRPPNPSRTPTTTSSTTPRTSSPTRPSTTACGSNSARRATSTSVNPRSGRPLVVGWLCRRAGVGCSLFGPVTAAPRRLGGAPLGHPPPREHPTPALHRRGRLGRARARRLLGGLGWWPAADGASLSDGGRRVG